MRSPIYLRLAKLFVSAALAACGADPDASGEPQDDTHNASSQDGRLSLVVNYLGTPIGGLTVEVSSNDCAGTVLDSAVTDGEGRVRFRGISASKVAVHVVSANGVGGADWVDTWTYDLVVDKPGNPVESVNVLQTGSLPTVEASASDFTPDPNMGAILGAAYLGEAERPLDRDFLGCVRVVLEQDPDNASVRYAGPGGLPAETAAQTETRSETGRFYVGNVTPGMHRLKAIAKDGSQIASAPVCVRERNPEQPTIALVGLYVTDSTALGECPY